MWGLEQGRCLVVFGHHDKPVTGIDLSPDNRLLLVGYRDRVAALWQVESGQCLRSFGSRPASAQVFLGSVARPNGLPMDLNLCGSSLGKGKDGDIRSVRISYDKRFVLTGGGSLLKLWEIASGSCLRTFEGHEGEVRTVDLSGDGRYALSGASDCLVDLWDLTTGRCVRTFEGHLNTVVQVRFSPDCQYAVSASEDGAIRLWHLDWDLDKTLPCAWDEGARPILQSFLTLHTPYAGILPQARTPTVEEMLLTQVVYAYQARPPTAEEMLLAIKREGRPTWTDEDFQTLLWELRCAGFGWLRPDGIRRELDRMASDRQGPPPLPEGDARRHHE